ncbi:MAG: UDP-glucose 4-epimerase [Candidatus Paraimprobicoccus trichonymphae]|uniref:UDP-glucose 4-epimerase n=1 Tax=Candidatus Paraimprobicoccus trichonymphae TaxID=3033793 RepID=A0AA48KW54_9FIRM|nr:MAG: UDP-glucose 4-epimerase [Candidatus Paraimprobicoccus trichonymphae]
MKKILVTGGAGYIGSHACTELLNLNYDVIILDDFSNSYKNIILNIEIISKKKIKCYSCNILDYKNLEKIFIENKIDAVMHFAALKSVSESTKNPLEYYKNNVQGTICLCEIMKKFNVKKMIFSSSATVYGDNKPPFKEYMETKNVKNPYGKTKYFIEQILRDIYISDKTWSIIILRYFNPIGAHKSGLIPEDPIGQPNNIMPIILRVASEKLRELVIFGNDHNTPDGTCIRDYIHILDLVSGHICALNEVLNKNIFKIFNLGTGIGTSVLELVKTFQKVNNLKVNYVFGKKRTGDISICYAESNLAKKHLNWKPKYNLEDMCKDAWNSV